jgi:hypothetical protein
LTDSATSMFAPPQRQPLILNLPSCAMANASWPCTCYALRQPVYQHHTPPYASAHDVPIAGRRPSAGRVQSDPKKKTGNPQSATAGMASADGPY